MMLTLANAEKIAAHLQSKVDSEVVDIEDVLDVLNGLEIGAVFVWDVESKTIAVTQTKGIEMRPPSERVW